MKLIDEALLDKFRGPGRCEFCGKLVSNREPHHILTRGAGRIDHPWNLLAICAVFSGGNDCHARIHFGGLTIRDRRLTREDLFVVVSLREGVPVEEITDFLYRVRRLPKGSSLEESNGLES